MNVKISLPDGSVREYPQGVKGSEIASSISEGLARVSLAIEVNGEIWDLSRPITQDASIKILTWNDKGGKTAFWHSSAHLMAEALEALYPGVKFGIGPPIENGFYYDIDLGDRPFGDDDLLAVENKMKELAKRDSAFGRRDVSKAEALDYFTKKDDPYKLELINGLEDGKITFYQQGNFVDLCKGPHIPHTGFIKAVKLLNVAGAYWRGNEKNKMLTRLYGITFPKQKELDERQEELKKLKTDLDKQRTLLKPDVVTQRERDLLRRRKVRMAADEHEAEHVVAVLAIIQPLRHRRLDILEVRHLRLVRHGGQA